MTSLATLPASTTPAATAIATASATTTMNGRKRLFREDDDGSLSSSSTSLPLKKRIHRRLQLEEQEKLQRQQKEQHALSQQEQEQAPQHKQLRPRFLHVHWALKPQVHHAMEHPDFNPNDVWYTRQEYDDFMLDRMRTVKFLRASGGDDGALDPLHDCLRGLEPFQTAKAHHDMHSKRQFHNATILLEQVRQSRLDKSQRDPDRFRELVSLESELALRRAQQLAVDTAEDAGASQRRLSACANQSIMMQRNGYVQQQLQLQFFQQQHAHHFNNMPAQGQTFSSNSNRNDYAYERQYQQQQVACTSIFDESPPSIFECGKLSPMSDRVRHLQQLHAQKLLNLYQHRQQQQQEAQARAQYSHTMSPSSVMSTYTLPDDHQLMDSVSRFPIRRDSLYGGMGRNANGASNDGTNGSNLYDGFQGIAYLPSVRRASLASAQTRMALRRGSWQGTNPMR